MQKKFKYFIVYFTLSCFVSSSQNEAKKWYFGGYAGLDFMTNPPTILTNGALNTNEGSASIADGAGNLLFYTNAATIWDQTHSVMANGTGLTGNFALTYGSAVIVKQPGNPNIYFVFTLGASSLTLNYSVVDMLAAGNGSVMVKNTVLASNMAGKLCCVRHCNGIDYWVVAHDLFSNTFRSFLVSSSGVNTTAVLSPAGSIHHDIWGTMKISPNGKKLGVAISNGISFSTFFELFDFDNNTGIVSNALNLGYFPEAYGCEFSPDGTKFYGDTKLSATLYQWDLCAGSNTAIVASQFTISVPSGIFGMQVATDGKIYVSKSGQQTLGVINNPNVAGSGCNYVHSGQSIFPNTGGLNPPNFVSSFFYAHSLPPFTYTLQPFISCNTTSFSAPAISPLCAAGSYSITGLLWDFGDPVTGFANVSASANPVHVYSSGGTYMAKLILYYNYSCGSGADTLKQTITINAPILSVSSTSITCASLGSATVSAIGGTGPYSYTWMPSMQTGSTALSLNPGNHSVIVSSNGGICTTTTNINFVPLIPLTGNVNNSPSLTCPGATSGTANVTGIAGGSGTQTYAWSNGSLTFTTAFANSLSAGLWSVTVTDALTGCQINQSFFITQPPLFNLSLTSNTPTTCAGTNIILTGTNIGGTPFTSGPGYTYTWTAAPPGNILSVSETTAGTYIYTLSSGDASNCIVSNTIAVGFIANPVLVVANVSICPLTVGTLTVSGASSYTWNGVTVGSTFSQSPVGSGQYTVVGSALSCTSIATASIIVMPLPNPFVSSNSPRCNGGNLLLNGNGGSSYVWTGPNSFNSVLQNPNINPVSVNDAGVYTLTVTAVNGCTASITKTVVVNPTPALSTTGSTVCTSQTLNLSASLVSGANYLWSGPLSFTSNVQNPFISNPLVTRTGTYTVKVISVQGCTNTAIAIASVVIPPSLTAQLSSYSLCSQAFNGSPNTITLTAGGASTYTLVTVPDMFNANPAGPVSPLTAIPPNTGAASATLSGSNGVCTVTTGLTFFIIPNPTVSVGSSTPVICAGETYTYTSQGAGSYSWSSATPGFTTYNNGGVAVASPSIHSVFSVFGASLGCNSASETSTITVKQLPLINLSPGIATVCIGSKVNLIATGTGNSYTWSPYLNINSMYGSTVNAFPTSQQTYTVLGSLNSCTSTAMITVSVLTLPSPIATVLKPTVCLNETVTLQGSGGGTYKWDGPNSIQYEGQTVNFAASSYIYAGTYTLTVADKNDCKASATTFVTIYNLPDGSLLGTQMKGCVPFRSDFTYYSALATSTSIATQWTVDSKLFSAKSFSNEFKVPGTYTITGNFKDTLTNCINTRTFVVEAYAVPLADFTYFPEKPIENLDEVIFTNTSKGEEQKKWDWFFVNNLGYRSQNKNTEYLFTEAGLYPIAMVVTNTWGCADTVIKSLKIESDLTVYVPNVFTPNDDYLNDVFLPVVRAIKSYELLVFDRWGTKIFSTTNIEVGWDGTYRGEQCKVDVYVWKINLSSVNGEMKTLTGSVLLNR